MDYNTHFWMSQNIITLVVWKLDVFELVDDLSKSLNLKEVYSQYIEFESLSSTAEEAIEKYSLDNETPIRSMHESSKPET